MQKPKALAAIIATTFALSACNDDDKQNNAPIISQTQITALLGEGYLNQASIYSLDENGNCDKTGELLATTNEQGKALLDSVQLENGYCAVTAEYSFSAPSITYLNQSTDSVVSPLTHYIQSRINQGNEELLDIKMAKQDLMIELGLTEADGDLLTQDYLANSSAISEGNNIVAAFASLLGMLYAEHENLLPKQVVNVAKVSKTQLDIIVQAPNSDDNSQLLASLNTFFSSQLSALETNDEDTLATLQKELNNIIDDLPKTPKINTDELKAQLLSAIKTQIATNADKSKNIELLDLQLQINSVEPNLVLTRVKKEADWQAELLSDIKNGIGNYSNNILTIDKLSFNQQGRFEFSLSVKKLINSQEYLSAPIRFSIDITANELLNIAPKFVGMQDIKAKELLAHFNNEDHFVFNPAFNMPEIDLFLPASFTFKPKDFTDKLKALFSDSNILSFDMLATDSNFFFMDMGDSMLLNSSEIEVPKTGFMSYQYRLFAIDENGARADTGFDFQFRVNADESAEITAIDSSALEDENTESHEPFLAVMLKPAQITALEETLLGKINNSLANEGTSAEQIFTLFEYSCDTEGLCKKDSSAEALAQITLETNPYFSLDSDGYFSYSGKAVNSETSFSLTATYQGEPVKVYAIDADGRLINNALDSYSSGLNINLNKGAVVRVKLN